MSVAAVFPGQGAQSVGMLADLAEQFPSVVQKFQQASDHLGFDVWKMVQEGPAEDLSATQNTQPILLTASVAIWDVWQSHAPAPAFIAGHSLGEYSALTCAGALEFADAVKLVRLRGELMEAAVPRGQGAMAAVMGLGDEEVVACCEATSGIVVAANFNAPGQVVIAGAAAAVQAAADACKDAGAKRAVMLDVSGPFHSPLMASAKAEFAQALGAINLQMPAMEIVQNVSGDVPANVDQLRDNLLAQIAEPVLWTKSVNRMVEGAWTSLLNAVQVVCWVV